MGMDFSGGEEKECQRPLVAPNYKQPSAVEAVHPGRGFSSITENVLNIAPVV